MSHIGIDLGTTFSAVATVDETGRPKIVPNPKDAETGGHGYDGNITPSCVGIIDGGNDFRVGAQPLKSLFLPGSKAAGRFKREMGTDKVYELNGKTLTPTDLSALVLARLKEFAEEQLGPITSAVVTVPANFTNEARDATLGAAKKAGLEVEHIINEPTAAAFYYAYKSGGDLSGNYVTYDLGGGTFDVTILNISGKDISVLSSNGVSTLGGDDFDELLVELVRRKYKDTTGEELDLTEYTKAEAEIDKKVLSSQAKTFAAGDEIGGENIILTKKEFEEAISSLIAQTEMLCESTLDEAGIKIEDVKEVILAGGSTRIPAVRESIKKMFGKKPLDDDNVDEVVAKGAALYAAYKSGGKGLNSIQRAALNNINLQEVSNFCFGTTCQSMNSETGSYEIINDTIIAKNTKLPAKVKKSYSTSVDNQTSVPCDCTQSTHEESDPNYVKFIWKGSLDGLPAGRPRGQQIDVTYSFDANNVMNCEFHDVASGKSTSVEVSPESDIGIEEGSALEDLLID